MLRSTKEKNKPRGVKHTKEMPKFQINSKKNDNQTKLENHLREYFLNSKKNEKETSSLENQLREEKRKNSKMQVNICIFSS